MTAVTDSVPVAHMQRLLEDVVRRIGYRKPRFEVTAGSQVGDNYLGVLYRVLVNEDEQSRDAKPALSLIFKGMPGSPKRREALRCVNFFVNETHMYKSVLPTFAKFLAAKGLLAEGLPFPCSPRCYEATSGGPEGEDTLVLQDMRPLHFTMHDRRVGLDQHHARLVLQALARIHATSLAIEAQRPDEFLKARGLLKETLFEPDHPYAEHFYKLAQRTYEFTGKRFPEGSEGHRRVKPFVDKYFHDMCELVQPNPAGGNAIGHGDCWTNNLLFRYSKGGAVEEVCLLDFQLSRYASPVLDILYLLFTCTVRAMRDAHMDQLLRDYHARLSDTLRDLGGDPAHLYSWDTMQAQLRSHGRYAFGMAILTVPLFLADSDEIPDLDVEFERGNDLSEVFSRETRSASERDNRISDVLQDLMERGWL